MRERIVRKFEGLLLFITQLWFKTFNSSIDRNIAYAKKLVENGNSLGAERYLLSIYSYNLHNEKLATELYKISQKNNNPARSVHYLQNISLSNVLNSYQLNRLGQYYLELDEIQKAEEVFGSLYKSGEEPHASKGLEGLSKIYIRNGDEKRALELIRTYQLRYPKFVYGSLLEADLYESLDKNSELENHLLKAAKHFDNDKRILTRLANTYEIKHEWKKSAEIWRKMATSTGKESYITKCLNALKRGGYLHEALDYIDDKYGNKDKAYKYLSKRAEVFNSFNHDKEALINLNAILSKFPDDIDANIAKSEIYQKQGKGDIALQLIIQLKARYPYNYKVQARVANYYKENEDWEMYHSACEEMQNHFPDKIKPIVSKFSALLSLNRLDDAMELYEEKLITKSNNPRIKSLIADVHIADSNFEKAKEIMHSISKEYPDHYGTNLKRLRILASSNQKEDVEESITYGKELLEQFNNPPTILSIIGESYISTKQYEKAEEIIKQIPVRFNDDTSILKLRSWQKMRSNNLNDSRQLWNKILDNNYFRSIHSQVTLKQIDNKDLRLEPTDVVVLSTIKNERIRLPFFLDYYRKIGVNKFIIVDNNSDDGTSEYLLEQPDVYIFFTNDNYAHSGCGMKWVNTLIAEYGNNNWCIFVDPDEFLVFSGSEAHGLKPLLKYMDDNNFTSFFSFMLDMYSNDTASQEQYTEGLNPTVTCPNFDNKYIFQGSVQSPYQKVYGGFRQRMFSEKEGLTKTPIIRASNDIQFIYSSHVTTPSIVCDVTGVLLHFKFLGDVKSKMNEASNSSSRYKSGRRYVKYAKFFSEVDNEVSYINDHSTKYTDSKQLLDLGLIKTSNKYEETLANE